MHSFKVKPKVTKQQSDEEFDGSMDIGYLDEGEFQKTI